MPHVEALKEEDGAKCPFAKQQSPTEEKQKRVTPRVDTDYMPGMVTLAASNKDEVKFLQELGFQLVDISQPVTISSPDGSEKQVKLDELGGVSLTLVIPGTSEPLHVVVTGTELVHELRQFTVERKESSYRTCLGLYHNGAKLEEFIEVASIEGIKNGSVIKFEEEPYSLRDARIHICRTKEILADNIDMLCSGSEGMSFSFLSHITITNPEEDVKAGASDATTTPTKEAVQPPNHCLPTAVNQHPPLSAFYPRGYHNKPPDCLKELHYSKWNPPPSQRQLRGDLLYLTVHTLEGEEYGITSCHSGFFVNKCSGDQVFDPNPAKLSHHSHHLIGLLNQVSPLFKKNFALLHKQGSKCHTLEVFPSPFKVYPWVVPHREHTLDNYFTLEGVFGAKVAIEEQFIGQSQDWNEQFQSIKEMPTATIAEKLAKEKAYYKAYMEYTNIAVKGAVAAVDGNIPPINCSEHVKQRMFIWNNIFLTFAFDSRDNYSDVGGDKAAWKAASHDLKNLSLLNSFDIEGIYCSATVIVDYRGYRVIAQTIIPGILSQNHEHTVSYGTIDNGKNISSNERLTEKFCFMALAVDVIRVGLDLVTKCVASYSQRIPSTKNIIWASWSEPHTSVRSRRVNRVCDDNGEMRLLIKKSYEFTKNYGRLDCRINSETKSLLGRLLVFQIQYGVWGEPLHEQCMVQMVREASQVFKFVDLFHNTDGFYYYPNVLKPVAKEFFFKEEALLDQASQEVSLVTSMDIKGIIGQDDRCYVVDLFRMLPPDANWFNWPDDCCFGKSEIAHPTVKTPNDKDDVSDGNTVGGVVRSAGNTTSSEKVTKISSKTVDLNEVSTTCDASVPSDTVTITLVGDKTIVQTTSGTAVIGTTSEDSTIVEPLNDATTVVAADKPSHETEDDVISDKFEKAASNIELSSSNGAVHSDENLNCRVESYVANSITSDTPCDREADISSYMLNGDGTNAHCNSERRDSHAAKLLDNENVVTGVSSHKPLDTATGMFNNEETNSELEVSRKDMVSSDSITVKQTDDTECDASADKTTDVEGVVCTTGDVNLDTKGNIPSDKETKESVKTDSPVNKRTDSEGDTIGDKRTDREGDECTLSDKRTCTKSDQINDKRAVTEGDTLTDKITDTVSEVLNRTHLGHGVTHKEIEASTKDDSISDYRLIIETYKKRMKQNQSRHKLKFLRPELVKAYIHFKRLVYIQLLSASMEMNKKKSKEETKAEDHVTEKTVSDCDTVKEHPSTTANGSGEIEPHPSSDIEDTATPEPCPSTLTNGIDHSDEECAVPNEGRTGSTLEVVNGRSPSLENHEELTTATTAAVSMDQSQSDHCPVSTSEAAAADIIMNKEDYFDIKFNIDLFTPGARHSKPEAELQKDFKILEDIGQFLLESVIPKLVNDCLQLLVVPSDGEALSNLMHLRGINMRYLGIIADLSTYRKDLDHLFQLCITEMVGRAAKRLLTSELQQGSLHNVATIIVCFLNCYLGLPAESSSEAAQEEPKKKSKKKRKGLSKTESLSLLLTKASVWSSIVEMIYNNFCYEMKYASLEELCTTLHISKIVLLRRLCKTSGIQLIVREYNFTAQPTFSEGDIINILPVVKTAVIKPTDGGALFELASSQVNAGNLGNAQELATQSLGVYSQVFGPLHSDVANCYRLMSRMHFMAGESVPAMCFQHKAVMIFERVLGMDHPDTVAAYVNLALYCHHCEQTTVALRLMYRVRYLILLMFGQDTPELATCDSNIALMLHSCKEYELSLIFLEHALRLNLKYHGEGSIQVALNHHLIARGLTFTGDFRSALHHEKITYNIHKEKFGENHQRTKESAECLEQLTEKAVKMQKQINEITSHFPSSSRATAGGVDVPGQWNDVAVMSNSSKKSTKSTRTKKKSRSKIDGEHVKGTTQ